MPLNIQFLRDMLTQDSTAIAQLHSLLIYERELLEQRKLEGMQEIVAQKDLLQGNLAFNAKQREQLLKNAGLPTTMAGWIQLLENEPAGKIMLEEWQRLTQQFVECQSANEINGRMINRSKQTLTHLLNLLRGQVAAPSLYTQKGSTTNQSNSYTVAKA